MNLGQNEYDLEHVSLEEFQSELLRLFKIVSECCDQLGLRYWVDSGTLLGAERHKGFIPWDDDLDLSLMKADFDVLIRHLDNQNFKLNQSCSLYYGQDNSSYWSDYLSSSNYVFRNYRGDLIPCHIDLFPFKALNDVNREEDKRLTNTAMYWVAGKVKYPELMTQQYLKYDERNLYALKKDWMRSFNDEHIKTLGSINDTTKYLTYSFEDFPYSFERPIFNLDEIFPLTTLEFEGLTVSAPRNTDSFLRKLYGSYTTLPPAHQRKPFGIEFYKTTASDCEKIKQNYIDDQFRNFYQRHQPSQVLIRAFRTLKYSGVKMLHSKIMSYKRY